MDYDGPFREEEGDRPSSSAEEEEKNEEKTNTRTEVFQIKTIIDSLNDNLISFLMQEGEPCDEDAKELVEANMMPLPANLMLAQAGIFMNRGELIGLTIKERHRTRLDPSILYEAIRSLKDVIRELGIHSVAIAKIDTFDPIP